MKRSNMYLCAAILLAVLLGLSACAGGSKSSQAAMTTAAYSTEAAAAETVSYDLEIAAGPMAGEKAIEAVVSEDAVVLDTASYSKSVKSGRKLIRNVNLSVETVEFDQLLKSLTDQVGTLGGYVEQSDISGNSLNYRNEPSNRYASLTVRIPLDKVDGFIAEVEKGGNVTNKSESTQDVTLQYSDLESRKKSLTVEQDRIWALLEKADTLEAVISLESRLSEIRYELESMESQLRMYDNQVEYSTVYLNINEIRDPAEFTPTKQVGTMERIQNGFSQNLKAITQGLTNFFIWLVTSSPFWIPLAVIALAVMVVVRRRNRKLREPLNPQDSQDKKDGDQE